MKLALATFAVLTTIGVAHANPRESVTFTNVENFGRYQQTGDGANPNPTLTHTFNGSDAGGSYNATYLTVTGRLTRVSVNTFFCEATIYCVPPSGTPFLIQPFNTAQSAVPGGPNVTVAQVPAGAYTVPVGPITTAGAWSFLFYERFNDITGRDSVWDTITITLNDGAPPTPAPIGVRGHTFTDVTVNQTDGGGQVGSFTLPPGFTAGGVRIRSQATALMTPNVNTTVTPTNNIRVRVITPDGVALAPATVFPLYSPSSDIGEVLVSLPSSRDSGGSWSVEAFSNVAGNEVHLRTLAVELVAPASPSAVNLGTLAANTPLSGAATVAAAGQTKWFRFSLPVNLDPLTNVGLELDTEGSTTVDGGGALNTSIGLYTDAGNLVGNDYVDGSQSLGMLTFGIDNHPAPGDGQIYNGRDGADVTAGDYFVAVTAGDTGVVYQPGVFGVTNASTQTGAVALHVRLVDPGAVTPQALDAGAIEGGPGGTEHTSIHAVTLTGPNQVKWIRFILNNDTSAGQGSFFDVFTDTDSADIDTEIGLYTPDGIRLANDDDDGVGYKSFLSFGIGGGPTVGDAGNGEGPIVSDGRDGGLDAGEYLLAVSTYNAAFGPQNWSVTTTGTDTGPVPVHFSTNLPSSTSACGPADIGIAGGLPGSDGHLDNNDFIAFITYFFNQDPIADTGVAGGLPGHDSLWDNNDFIAFINDFFSGPASCR